MDRLTEMEAFVNVVDNGGFTGAAAKLSISKSAISKHVSALEKRLGARLLNRTTRRVNATEIGLAYYDKVRKVLDAANEANDSVAALQDMPRGHLRVVVPVAFGVRHAGKAVSAFLQAHPEISIDLHLDDKQTDLVLDGFDVAIRIGMLLDSSLLARRVATTKIIVAASPLYLEEHGTPKTIDDLNQHALLHRTNTMVSNHWRLLSPNGEERQVRARGPLSTNNGDVLLQAAIDGLGIVMLPDFYLDARQLEEKKLVRILPHVKISDAGIHLVYPPGKYIQPKTRAFIDFMATYFGDYDLTSH